MKTRDYLKNKASKDQLEKNWNDYKLQRNKVTKLIDEAKRTYYNNLLTENANNTRKFWPALKTLLPKKENVQGCAPLLALVNRGARGGGAKNSITILSVNAHHYKYSILKREIKRRLNTNQKHSNINKEIVLYYIKGHSSRLVIEK